MRPLLHTLSQMEPPPFGDELEKRRGLVIDWLRFIRDFGHLDTNLLIARAAKDDDFVDAVETVAATGSTAAEVFDAVRNFVVQHSFHDCNDKVSRPTTDPRLSPFSVPLELLRKVFGPGGGHSDGFNPKRLRVNTWTAVLNNDGPNAREILRQNTLTLLTTCWARLFPRRLLAEPIIGDMQLVQTGPNTYWKIPLLAALTDRVPLFLFFGPNDGYVLSPPRPMDGSVMIYVFLEGWMYEFC